MSPISIVFEQQNNSTILRDVSASFNKSAACLFILQKVTAFQRGIHSVPYGAVTPFDILFLSVFAT